MSRILSAVEARSNMKHNAGSQFPGVTDARYDGGLIFPFLEPTFKIEAGQKVFTIGSCFARNIEEQLALSGVKVPTTGFTTPRDEITETGRPNKALNQYNVGTMLQSVRAVEDNNPTGGLFPKGEGQVVDALLATGGFPVTVDRAIERRGEIRELYSTGLAGSDATIITLGLTEAWYDTDSGLYLNMAPNPRMVAKEPDRFKLVFLSVDDIVSMLDEIIERVAGLGCQNILLTVSPVPLGRTFDVSDCVVANMASKATLRAAAAVIAAKHSSVDYFPSYEIVMSAGTAGFGKDNVHVRSDVVAKIVKYMLSAYMHQIAETPTSA